MQDIILYKKKDEEFMKIRVKFKDRIKDTLGICICVIIIYISIENIFHMLQSAIQLHQFILIFGTHL